MILMRTTMWVHANSVHIEHPERLAWVQRAGFSTRVQSQDASHNWFHFAIPTPMIIDDSHFRAAERPAFVADASDEQRQLGAKIGGFCNGQVIA